MGYTPLDEAYKRLIDLFRFLRDLSMDLPLWGRFFDDPVAVSQEYGFTIPEGVVQGRLRSCRCPPASLFAVEPDWVALTQHYLGGEKKDASAELVWPTDDYAELILALSGAKPTVRSVVSREKLAAAVPLLQAREAALAIVPFQIQVRLAAERGSFSSLCDRLPLTSPEKEPLFFVYVSVEPERAQAAALLDAVKADVELGRVLGFPECCLAFFSKTFVKASGGDLTPFAVRNTLEGGPYPFYLNNVACYFGGRLIRHFPCRYTCKASAEQGRRYLEVLRKELPAWADTLELLLQCPVIYSKDQGVFLLDGGTRLDRGGVVYDPAQVQATTADSELYHIVKSSDRVNAIDGEQVVFHRGNVPTGKAGPEV